MYIYMHIALGIMNIRGGGGFQEQNMSVGYPVRLGMVLQKQTYSDGSHVLYCP